ncbi:hypothetical protein [Marinitoga aeolica]|uniref:Uncharacterized protein n=1 Tax=Marinitoga aeolica TaxID=2809031 RepID=A0ABY8PQM2_9BACT|nr:hypothetical protein [Marinitoga aeolica]WGS64923.1 hypothetical protein JRV97_11295 [Marinitoga aeolica]
MKHIKVINGTTKNSLNSDCTLPFDYCSGYDGGNCSPAPDWCTIIDLGDCNDADWCVVDHCTGNNIDIPE